MMPGMCNEQAPVPPPSYSRAQVQAQAERARALHINALNLIQTLHLLALCRISLLVEYSLSRKHSQKLLQKAVGHPGASVTKRPAARLQGCTQRSIGKG
jgi:hypothetical protein